ncbi:SMC-Scp complex subunit ScpB [Ructibacterium gallinarum]|uniref:Segregation and condensation protein B n=1 Tax=Ructibacterium gallinarum TaxID=2779355 RepID=A0A9D5M4C2_9FIRM|nr:SMC-Scp complex subunit ScpB [Ructibacterium gallinarum]MBE5039319.1 SMC-Scp complex subunit ScpB [Ructibacterium gallinarum]
MEIREIQAVLESVLFAAGDAVQIEKLADIVDVDKRSLREILKKMMDEYNYERRGIHIIQLEDAYQMCTRGEYHDYVAMLAEPRRKQSLSNAAMEVLAVVAYKQPVTKSTIEHIRGVNCDYIVNRLVERNLVEEVGRLDAPGRPILFGTTQEFLRCFGIASLSDLPDFESFGGSEEEGEQLEMELAPRQMEFAAVGETEETQGKIEQKEKVEKEEIQAPE